MFVPAHSLHFALGRVHSQLHPRNPRILQPLAHGVWLGDCVCKDDGPNSRGIPDIYCQFVFSDYEDWDTFVVRFWRALENEKNRLGYYN